MQKWGLTKAGKQRWYCSDCELSAVRKRSDQRARMRWSLFVSWLIGKKSLEDISSEQRLSIRSLSRWFAPFWRTAPTPTLPSCVRILVLDATSIVPRQRMVFIGTDAETGRPVSWADWSHESHEVWSLFLAHLDRAGIKPQVVVCDAQRGLLKAIREVWPDAIVQRCLIHVVRQAMIWLTKNPKTIPGVELRALVGTLPAVRSREEAERWVRSFNSWSDKSREFLRERSEGPDGTRWYTHRKLRGVRSLIANAIPDLFHFTNDVSIPRTSNHVEGGINARLKELLRCHRGIQTNKKLVLVAWYLAIRQGQKPTRDVY